METSGNMEAALQCAKMGIPVFPVHFPKDGRCSCGKADCTSPAKHPLTARGCLDATLDESQIVKWWTANPDANIGAAVGGESEFVVVDLDGQAGIDAWNEWQDQHGSVRLPISATGGGGRHIWLWAGPDAGIRNATRIHGLSIDVRGDGGYVLWPGSRHMSGTAYTWLSPVNENASYPADEVDRVLDWIRSAKDHRNGNGSANGKANTMKMVVLGDLDSPGVGEGERHDKLTEYVGRHLARGETGTAVLSQALRWAATCTPPMDEDEVFTVVSTLEAKHRGKEPPADPDGGGSAGGGKGQKQPSQSARLVQLCDGVELFHDTAGDGYACFQSGDHRESHPIRSRAFRQWLAAQFWEACGQVPSSQSIVDAINTVEGHAVFRHPEESVFVRVAPLADAMPTMADATPNCLASAKTTLKLRENGQADATDKADAILQSSSHGVVIDLGTADWRVVIVTADGWQIVDRSPVRFRRPRGMRPLPIPQPGGRFDTLRALLNVRREDWPLVAAFMLGSLSPTGPYAILALYGEAGSGKSTTSRVIRFFVDPNESPLRREPRNEHDLVIAAHNGWVVTLDNLSRIPTWLSDGLCRLSTGGGFSTRTLYSDSEETIFNATRPCIINGIDELATRGDLVDRTLPVVLERIDDGDRMPEAEFWGQVEQYAPQIMGGLLDALSLALRKLPITRLDNLPRMADFAVFATAGETGLGLSEGEFISTYRAAAASANTTVLDASLVAQAVEKLMAVVESFSGSASELKSELDKLVSEQERKSKSWPADARWLSGQLRRLAPNLRKAGIIVDFNREGKKRSRTINISRCEDSCNLASAASAASATTENSGNTPVLADARRTLNTPADANPEVLASATRPAISGENALADAKYKADANSQSLSGPGPSILMEF